MSFRVSSGGPLPRAEDTAHKVSKAAKIIGSRNVPFSAFFAVLTYEGLYRTRLYLTVYGAAKNSTPILGFLPESSSKLGLAAGFFQDVLCACASAILIWIVASAVDKIPFVGKSRYVGLFRSVVIVGILLCISLTFCLHYSLLTYFHAGPTRGLLLYALQDFKPSSYLSFVTPLDTLFLLIIVPIYFLHVLAPDRARLVLRSILIVGAVISTVLFLLNGIEERKRSQLFEVMEHGRANGKTMAWPVAPELRANPLIWILRKVVFAPPGRFGIVTRIPEPEQRGTVAFIDPAFAISQQAEEHVGGKPQTQWNIVFLLLESLNASQLTGLPGQRSPMPFTDKLADQSLVLENHFSGGIDTDYATFPIFTGIYPMPAAINFADRANVRFPTLFSFTQPTYSSSFVTDGDTNIWYPVHLLLNTGLHEVWDAQNLPTHSYEVWFSAFKDPSETTDFFLKQVNSLQEPFVAVYNIQATHSPYFDYQRKGIYVESGAPQERYEEDVTLVDRQIESVLNALIASGRAQRTIFVITADHGEAFGEHSNNFGHGLYLFNESVHVPMLFYQPHAISPGKIVDVTSHVDILPTLLDVMKISYDPLQFQGESVFRKLRRKYVFIYGPKADAIASVSRDGVKVIVVAASNQCTAFDLKVDPKEARPQQCGGYQEQVDALLEYRRHQLHLLANYDMACQKAWPCAHIEPYDIDSNRK